MIRLVIGRKGMGKTTLAYYMARKSPRLVVFDPRGLVRRPGATIARTTDTLSLAIDILADDETTEVVYTPTDDLKAVAWPHFAGEMRRWAYDNRDQPLAVLVDEISFVPIGDDDFDQAIKACDETRLHFFLTCHRPTDVPVSIRALTDFWYLFPIHQEHDLAVIADRCSPATATAVHQLTGRSFVGWNHRDGVTRYENPAAWYVDLHPAIMLVPPVDLDPV